MASFDDVVPRLFPRFVRGVLAATDHDCESPHQEERAAVAGAVENRRREFLCGRACAHAALRAIGLDRGPIAVGTGRQPVWPTGAVGSISHAGDWSGAVVARAADAWALGFDMEELDPPLTPEVERLVLTPDERRPPGSTGHPLAAHRSKIAYSVKESVYKCLFPRTGWRLAFDDVTVEVDLHRSRAEAQVDERFRSPAADLSLLEVGVVVADGYVFTGLCITARAGWGPGADTSPAGRRRRRAGS
ncbi:MAG TPA: 4'-phosphopantetheinyl transferase superfamily protein [Acidimicrobiales bacterium]|nr:4'-phosphopantetheinyl transferase superfamily protein [Acidimicrobiales bacterium]